MSPDRLRRICRAFPHVTEDIKWGNDLVFSIGKKMFSVIGLEPPFRYSFKCSPEEFAEMIERDGVIPAPYMARNKWVLVEDDDALATGEAEKRLRRSYDLVKATLSKKLQAELAGPARRPRSR
jgi:predicted DNA-binding protein (MmcQ/YjbR family)